MPPQLFRGLIQRIDRIQQLFDVFAFTDATLRELQEINAAWQDPGDDGRRLATAISDYFIAGNRRTPVSMDKLLAEIAPRLLFVLEKAIEDWESRTSLDVQVERDLDGSIEPSHRVLGSAGSLSRTLSNLLANACNAWRKVAKDRADRGPALRLRIVTTAALPHMLVVKVCDNVIDTGKSPSFFEPGNALAAQKAQIEKWGGSLRVDRVEGWTVAHLELKTIRLERVLQDPHL